MDMRELDRQALRMIAQPMEQKSRVKRVYWTVVSETEGGILLDESGCLVRFACPETGQTTNAAVVGQRLSEIRPDPAFRRLYVGDLDKLGDIAQTLAKQDIIVCLEWRGENMPTHAYAYYHRACFFKEPVELPKMKKHYLLQNQLLSPSVLCLGCGLFIE